MNKGYIKIGEDLTEVYYYFIDEDTIEFIDPKGDYYFTHYKSLIVGSLYEKL